MPSEYMQIPQSQSVFSLLASLTLVQFPFTRVGIVALWRNTISIASPPEENIPVPASLLGLF